MPQDKLSNQFLVKDRSTIRDDYGRDFRSRVPAADFTKDSQLFVEASTFADGMMPFYSDVSQVAAGTSRGKSKGPLLDQDGADIDVERGGPGKSTGFVVPVIASGGATVGAGTILKRLSTNQKFETLVSDVYLDGDKIAVRSLDTGTATNLDAGVVLNFETPPPGVGGEAIIFANEDESGLTGGTEVEGDEAYRQHQDFIIANPPAGGNSSEIIEAVKEIKGLAIEAAFTVPASNGPGTQCVMFTMRPALPGASRLPNDSQIAEVATFLESRFPESEGILVASGADDLVTVIVKVDAVFVDAQPWPPLLDPTNPAIVDITTSTPTACRITSSAVMVDPQVGQTIAFYDSADRSFKRKRIATVFALTPSHSWLVTFDTDFAASDPSFTPAKGAIPCPWSDALTSMVAPILKYVDSQGPGEMVATLPEPGLRQRRFPAPLPDQWPSVISNRIVIGLDAVVGDAELVAPAPPKSTQVGIAGALFWLHRVSTIGVFPQ